jgi:hypothetical protein
MENILIVKSNGAKELFDQKKLTNSLQKSGASEEEITQTVEFVVKNLKGDMSTGDIYALAYKELKAHRKYNPNAIRYSLKRSVMELGPTGFPFEQFVARIFGEIGYQCQTGVFIQGKCIEHEVDILAYNDTEVICMEAKFHNEPHLKSDVKVALYVKARFDDLLGQDIKIGESYRKINKAVLITNTNFTDNAYQYVECSSTFELMSWNNPADKNILYYIETYNLYPVGIIPELSRKEIDQLVGQGILLCSDLKKNFKILDEIGIKKSKQEVILNTINSICNC